ncbi:MAG: cyclic peptide export ABC transporter [Gammaproteobacteria bacterium]|nr:cyclic peptide export ABC transporter [Gammaproteobacteria bacterium]MBU2059491.1 cyclic peptide export ABC transporter [Gammaproteobacteria bacterium]MBU2176215.1 cyclic peptide export ABC transporter [Gammaproteobacteria bacterium]MBU2248148.1 cyclic peptide export ABC transporter [Gammaproteobacteria bacterium]MBU2344571.1 cyclic peptide export ABC transporter [Gammaproteobacteria bacterium]
MSILAAFTKKSSNKLFLSLSLGALSGVLFSGIMPMLMSGIQPEDPNFESTEATVANFLTFEFYNYKLAALFFVTCFFIFLTRTLSELILLRLANDVAKDIRTEFYYRISQAPLPVLEQLGSSKFISSINIDVPKIIAGAKTLPVILVNSITLLGMLGFLAYLNFSVFKLVMVAIVVGTFFYQVPMLFGKIFLQRSRDIRDDLQESIRGLIFGIKEIKLDTLKRDKYFDLELLHNEKLILLNENKSQTIIKSTKNFGDLIGLLVIGLVCFVFINYYSVAQHELIGVVMALLYVTGPISALLNSIPDVTIASISYRKLNDLLAEIPSEDVSQNISPVAEWSTLRFEKVEYQYPGVNDDNSFKVGPLNLEIKKGEITFIVGANGSGKSTLSKLLTLHYRPSSGNILFGDIVLSDSLISSYRQIIGAIYTDFYLFDRLLIEVTDDVAAQIQNYLVMLHLDKKVSIFNGQFSTTSLSDGQRKRLALLVAFLEDKQVYLFDEWAADQDPLFKAVFYNEILPNLKLKNKAIIVISHDDSYFELADQMLVMEQGMLMLNTKSLLDDASNKKIA